MIITGEGWARIPEARHDFHSAGRQWKAGSLLISDMDEFPSDKQVNPLIQSTIRPSHYYSSCSTIYYVLCMQCILFRKWESSWWLYYFHFTICLPIFSIDNFPMTKNTKSNQRAWEDVAEVRVRYLELAARLHGDETMIGFTLLTTTAGEVTQISQLGSQTNQFKFFQVHLKLWENKAGYKD